MGFGSFEIVELYLLTLPLVGMVHLLRKSTEYVLSMRQSSIQNKIFWDLFVLLGHVVASTTSASLTSFHR